VNLSVDGDQFFLQRGGLYGIPTLQHCRHYDAPHRGQVIQLPSEICALVMV
jgi:hypothetical protein